jgi:uncharacterized membrane protein YheB (UPF0754 family)
MTHYFIILIAAATAGCLIGLLLRSAIISRLPALLQRFAANMATDLFTSDNLDSLSAKNNFENIRPLIEVHIDEFLGHKLGKEMPMIGMFIGEKTIAQLKGIFMKELEEIFPMVMEKYIGDLSRQVLASRKITAQSKQKFRSFLNKHARSEMMLIPVYGAIAGIAIGILQLMIILLIP